MKFSRALHSRAQAATRAEALKINGLRATKNAVAESRARRAGAAAPDFTIARRLRIAANRPGGSVP